MRLGVHTNGSDLPEEPPPRNSPQRHPAAARNECKQWLNNPILPSRSMIAPRRKDCLLSSSRFQPSYFSQLPLSPIARWRTPTRFRPRGNRLSAVSRLRQNPSRWSTGDSCSKSSVWGVIYPQSGRQLLGNRTLRNDVIQVGRGRNDFGIDAQFLDDAICLEIDTD